MFQLGNHDRPRLATRFNPNRVDIFNILLKTLPGITVTYNGEEIGMTDVSVPFDKIQDPAAKGQKVGHIYNRDETRSPFQWDDTENAGFSTGSSTWLPVADNYTINNVQLQQSQNISHFQVFKQLISLRQHPTMKYGAFDIKLINEDVIVYKRQMKGKNDLDVFVIVLNLGTSKRTIRLRHLFKELVPQRMTVAISSIHSKTLIKG